MFLSASSTNAPARWACRQEEIRARNFIKPSQMPFATKTDRTYDVGDFEGAMRACAAKADVKGFSARAEASKAKGRLRGIGFSSYIECTAWGEGEQGSVAIEKNGDFTVLIGTQSNGQGHETAYAQVVAEYLDVPLERVKVVQGDSDRMKTGGGTGGSRSIPIGAVMLQGASRKLVASLKELASDKLEAAVQDLEIADGGDPHRRHRPFDLLCRTRRASGRREPARRRQFRSAGGDLSERNAYCRSRGRPGHRRDGSGALLHRRRFRHDAESRCCWRARFMAASSRAWDRRCLRKPSMPATAS